MKRNVEQNLTSQEKRNGYSSPLFFSLSLPFFSLFFQEKEMVVMRERNETRREILAIVKRILKGLQRRMVWNEFSRWSRYLGLVKMNTKI